MPFPPTVRIDHNAPSLQDYEKLGVYHANTPIKITVNVRYQDSSEGRVSCSTRCKYTCSGSVTVEVDRYEIQLLNGLHKVISEDEVDKLFTILENSLEYVLGETVIKNDSNQIAESIVNCLCH